MDSSKHASNKSLQRSHFCKFSDNKYSSTKNLTRVCSFAEILQSYTEHQILRRMSSIVFLAFTLKPPIQISLSVASTCSVLWCATQFQQNEHIPATHNILTKLTIHFHCISVSSSICESGSFSSKLESRVLFI